MRIITRKDLDRLSRTASRSERRRKNLNLHDDFDEPCQRLFNALEPGTYVRPHRHSEPARPESLLAVRGRMALVVFDEQGNIEQVLRFGAGCDVVAVDLPGGTWHTLIALDAGSIFFEAKPGPYDPLLDKDFAPWAPAEGMPGAADYLARLMAIINTDR